MFGRFRKEEDPEGSLQTDLEGSQDAPPETATGKGSGYRNGRAHLQKGQKDELEVQHLRHEGNKRSVRKLFYM